MKWGVQQVSVTLESDSGETLVVEQRPDGKVVCKPVPKDKAAAKPDKPATKPDKPAAKPRAPRKPKADKPPTKAPKATKAPEPKATPEPEAKPEPKPAPQPAAKQPRTAQAREPLDWHTIDDHGYTGIGALATWGAYKALRAKTAATYALFFETANQPPHHIGCFRTLDEVKKRAQQIHDSGWPPFVGVTKADVEGACPAPTATPTADAPAPAEPKPTRARKPRAPKAAPAPQPAAEPSPATADATATTAADASQDEELMRSLSAALAANLPDEDD